MYSCNHLQSHPLTEAVPCHISRMQRLSEWQEKTAAFVVHAFRRICWRRLGEGTVDVYETWNDSTGKFWSVFHEMYCDLQVLDSNNNALEVTRLHTFFRCRSACAISKKAKGTTISSTRCVPTGFRFRSGKIFKDSVTWVDHLAALIAGLRCCCTCIRFQLFAWHQGLSLSRPTECKAKSCKDYISMCLHSPSAAGQNRPGLIPLPHFISKSRWIK